MKTKQSILRQLLVNILVPVLLIFSIVFYLTYQYNLDKVENDIDHQKKSIVAETKNLIEYYDFSMRTHEQSLIERMQDASREIQFVLAKQPAKSIDLLALRSSLGLDSSREDIYLIDRNLKIVNTTFKPDMGFDFKKLNKTFISFFSKIFQSKTFKEDRFGLEIKTGKIKKYSYQTSLDGKHIIELGFYSKSADEFKELLLSKIRSLEKRFEAIGHVKLYLGVKHITDNSIKDPELQKAYLKCLDLEKHMIVNTDDPASRGKELTEYIFLPVLESKLYSGYVLELGTNDLPYQNLVADLLWRFGVIFLLTLVILTVIVYFRSRKLTRPIQELARKTATISTDNLDQTIEISGSLELNLLSKNFNSMMQKLRHSYENLEDKVIERTQELQEQKLIVESKNHEIVESIQYARFIQQALLPLESEIQASFDENAFVYYAPKDIIAGDFFWFEKRNDVSWFAVADCTGHGVPGALVSVLCINALNQSLAVNENQDTGELLDHVRELVVQTLTKEARSVKDGMDISLACFNHKTKTLQWTGANNPLWIFRGDEILVTSPDKQPVGQFDGAKPFTTHEIQLEKNDWIILFSDGYADQFGGPKNKKYKYATFKDFIQKHKDRNGTELKASLKEEFESWKGPHEQTDDVCVMGIKIMV
ncbi:MAG: protein serine/threonine phosphatase with extracellular sensor [Fluviicola sp.]|uniref:SpoIIE family protein phosphatase n=1 Tax=Fluviicola sp. TaxID=1917219 RepID=UPI0026196DA6|nr:SpoIIE family protein phosphatase [Fluviicola sp.]MDF3028450.1 protein serine/threonine phosphatase with extracellular sensor [Fluviicola sp.]